MKKQSVAKIILIYFFKTIGILALLVGVGVLSYYLTMLYFKQTDKQERSTTYTHVISVNAGAESSNLIYSYNENDGQIGAMMLELFDQNTKNMSYVTIPTNTQITISQALYQELLKVNGSLPQVMRLTDIQTYFTGDVAYEYGIRILQDTLPVDIGYFTAMPDSKFKIYYEYGVGREGCYSPTNAYITSMKKCTTKSDMDDMITDLWDEQISDITLSQKLNYSESLAKVNWDFVHVYCLKGNDDGSVFTIDAKKSKKLISDIWECEAYTQAQYETAVPEQESVDEQNIEILNGSAIDGLASRYQKNMQADGLSVVNIGNYTGIKQETSTIYAKNVKWAKKNLRSYFPHPKNVAVEKAGELDEGIDVQIVLGVDADE
ncbi:MAG: LytR C-terminal domain-containing protein [Eubacterium sp.]|nr:LytR C-terminal domain-containing protein [Eubacterium sp.]